MAKEMRSDSMEVQFKLTNTCQFEGAEVVQLYIYDVTAIVVKPVKELKKFAG